MKLAYSTWHKELVHDDTIRAELNSLTGGALEFSNTPFIKHRNQIERDDYGRGPRRQQSFGGRGRDNRGGGGRDNRGGGGGNRNNRNGGGGGNRDNRMGGGGSNRSGGFKKRY
jgi:hypothetical protein